MISLLSLLKEIEIQPSNIRYIQDLTLDDLKKHNITHLPWNEYGHMRTIKLHEPNDINLWKDDIKNYLPQYTRVKITKNPKVTKWYHDPYNMVLIP